MNYIYSISGIPIDIVFEGYSLQYTNNIILSSSDTSKTVPLCSYKPKSSKFSEISGTTYYNYSIISNNLIKITLKNIESLGIYDLIVLNDSGYKKLSEKNYLINVVDTIPSVTPTETPTLTPTINPTISITPTNTQTPTNTPTITLTPTKTQTPAISLTPTISITPTNTLTPTQTITETFTQTPTITETPTQTPTVSITPTITLTPTPTITETLTQTPTVSITPSITLTPTQTQTPTITPTITITSSSTVDLELLAKEEIVMFYNSNSQDSIDVANYYKANRPNFSQINLVGVDVVPFPYIQRRFSDGTTIMCESGSDIGVPYEGCRKYDLVLSSTYVNNILPTILNYLDFNRNTKNIVFSIDMPLYYFYNAHQDTSFITTSIQSLSFATLPNSITYETGVHKLGIPIDNSNRLFYTDAILNLLS